MAAEPIEVMILGTYHLDNPGADLHNMKADDVLTPRRQMELERLADELARYNPTKIMVEREAKGPTFVEPSYLGFDSTKLLKERSETTQIGFRLAHKLGHNAVYGIDERPSKGEPDYFPIEKVQRYIASHGHQADFKLMNDQLTVWIKSMEEKQKTASVAEILMDRNNVNDPINRQAFYYGLLRFGDGEDQPGADLNAGWYLRNAKIFAKLIHAAKPGDRVLVIFGAGHRYWLRHFAEETPGIKLVDPLPYLRKAAEKVKK